MDDNHYTYKTANIKTKVTSPINAATATFILAVCTCLLRKCDRFEVIRDFCSLKKDGNPFPVDRNIGQKM
jgi:hypothetical protein